MRENELIYKKLKDYKIPILKFSLELEEEIIKQLIRIHGGRIDEKTKAQTRFGTPHKSSVHLWQDASESE